MIQRVVIVHHDGCQPLCKLFKKLGSLLKGSFLILVFTDLSYAKMKFEELKDQNPLVITTDHGFFEEIKKTFKSLRIVQGHTWKYVSEWVMENAAKV